MDIEQKHFIQHSLFIIMLFLFHVFPLTPALSPRGERERSLLNFGAGH
jgi:hypothetical protein